MTMTDEKYDRIETAAVEVVDALQPGDGDDPPNQIRFDEMDAVTQNRLRVQLAEIYSRWEKQWESEANEGRRRLGKVKL